MEKKVVTREITVEEAKGVNRRVHRHLKKFGFESKLFLAKWYNELVKPCYALPVSSDDCVCLCLVSNADMYDTMLRMERDMPLGNSWGERFARDPIHTTTRYYVQQAVNSKLLGTEFGECVEIVHDFELRPNRMPRVLMQTAGHVSGHAFFYQPRTGDPKDVIAGVAIHKKYGGWFGYRGIIILHGVTCPTMKQVQPVDVVGADTEKRVELLRLFAKQDWSYRDIVPVQKRYGKRQAHFFKTLPGQRKLIPEEQQQQQQVQQEVQQQQQQVQQVQVQQEVQHVQQE